MFVIATSGLIQPMTVPSRMLRAANSATCSTIATKSSSASSIRSRSRSLWEK